MKKIKIAVTGGIGSGKSTVLSCLFDMGYPVFSCDEIYKEVIVSQTYVEHIQREFPSVVENGVINREKLGLIVFNDSDKREKLNQLAHPLVMKILMNRMNNCTSRLAFAEIPLLFEGNFENMFDHVLVVTRAKEKRITDLENRDHRKRDAIEKRIQAQFDYFSEEGIARLKNCNAYIIKNENSIQALQSDLQHFIEQL